jgi:hypothetical protein
MNGTRGIELTTTIPGPLIAKGRTSEVYAWQEKQVLKLFYDWCPPHWIQHEIDIGHVMRTMVLSTPKMLDTVKINGRQGIIYERVEGLTMLGLLNSKPWLVRDFARQLAELQTQIHQQDGSSLHPVRSSLKATILQVENLPSNLKTSILQLLEKLPDGSALCHFDLHPGQVLITAEGPVVIDWMTACQGHPLADVARSSIIFSIGQVPGARTVKRVIFDLLRGLFYRTYLSRYLELHPGFTREAVTTWMVPVAAGRLKEGIPGEEENLLKFIQTHL